MLYSRSCEYAIRAMTRLARLQNGAHCPIHSVGRDEKIPLPFLAKIMRDLGRAGLVEAVRGRGGGIRLAEPAAHLTLLDIVRATDGTHSLEECVAGREDCNREGRCPYCASFEDARQAIHRFLSENRLSELAKTSEGHEKKQVEEARILEAAPHRPFPNPTAPQGASKDAVAL